MDNFDGKTDPCFDTPCAALLLLQYNTNYM